MGYRSADCAPLVMKRFSGTGTKFVIGGEDSAPAGSALTRTACSEKAAAGGCDATDSVGAGLSLGADAMGSAGFVGCEAVAASDLFDSTGKWADGPTISQTIGYRIVLNPIENAIMATAPKAGSIFGIVLFPMLRLQLLASKPYTTTNARQVKWAFKSNWKLQLHMAKTAAQS